jgi:hypothetical protein
MNATFTNKEASFTRTPIPYPTLFSVIVCRGIPEQWRFKQAVRSDSQTDRQFHQMTRTPEHDWGGTTGRGGRNFIAPPYEYRVIATFTIFRAYVFPHSNPTLVGVVLIIRAYTRVYVSSYRVSVSPAVVIRHELTQALTWHCLYSVRHVDHRRRRSWTSAVPARRT